ncbi:MAG: hypothetical protein ACKVX7_11360 [Planctomycetota bacterium]
MRSSSTATALALAISAILVGCSMRMKAQDVALRIDAAADTAELLVVYQGVSASGPGELNNALSHARAVLDHEPLLWIPDWSVNVNFAALARDTIESEPPSSPLERDVMTKLREFARDAKLVDAEAFVVNDELCAYQRFRFVGVSRLIAAANDAIHVEVLEGSDDDVDARTNELWRQRAVERTPWFRLEAGGELVIEIPISRAAYEKFRSEVLIGDIARDPGGAAWLGRRIAHLSRFTYDDELVTLRFAPLANGLYHSESSEPKPEPYEAALKESLEREGCRFRDDIDVEALKAEFVDEVGIRVKRS